MKGGLNKDRLFYGANKILLSFYLFGTGCISPVLRLEKIAGKNVTRIK